MKQMLLAAILAALASSALTLLLAGSGSPAAAPAPAGMSAADFKAALADLEREVAALRRDLSAGPPGPAPGAAEAVPLPPRLPSATAPPAIREPKAAEVPVPAPEGLKRFAEAIPRTAEGERDVDARGVQKRRWFFRSEREVLEWFGLPFNVDAKGEKETWSYEIPTGEVDGEGYPLHRNYWIVLNRGRLIDMGD